MGKTSEIYGSLGAYGFQQAGQCCYGMWQGWAVTLRPYNSALYYLDVATDTDGKDKDLVKGVRQAVKDGLEKRANVLFAKGTVSLLVKFSKARPYAEQFTAYAGALTAALRQNGVSPARRCAVCGAAGADSLCLLGSYHPVHRHCVQETVSQARDAVQDNEQNGSYLTGAVGALLGMLVGLIPSVLTIQFMERIYAVLFALVPLASMWGYRKLRGRMTKGAIVIVLLFSLLSVLLIQLFSVALYAVLEYGLTAGEASALLLYVAVSQGGIGILMEGSLQLFLFMLLGIWIAWRYVSQTNAGHLRQAAAVLETLRPLEEGYTAPEEDGE